jgi:aryl-alcohol dehydrogenase-like predicted oxidoreductase
MGLSAFYASHKTTPEQDKINLLLKTLSLGINFWDTSNIYGPHTNELLIGKTLKDSQIPRSQIIIATKFGVHAQDGNVSIKADRAYVRECCLGSLQRLGLDYIDLYYVHRMDQTVPIEETMEELVLLIKEGKIKHIGLSEAHPDTIRRAHAVYPLTAVQLEWSLWSRDVEEDLIPVLRELGIGIVCYSPLGRGFLTGAIQKTTDLTEGDWRLKTPRFQEGNLNENVKMLETLKKIAEKRGKPEDLGVIALAWVQNQGEDVVTIPGTTSEKHLLKNFESIEVKLTAEEMKELSEAFPLGKVVGERYSEGAPYRNDKNPKKQ